ncbi:RICIN domain-containing protein [Acrocarpospora sp. B8E8]|uniref:RICIN domain-containing protein n=1 Tax=Acrocarpospora sp. B8E8 TaxID=3153572 RepID=UPI00325F9201
MVFGLRQIRSLVRAKALAALGVGVLAGLTAMPAGTAYADSMNRWATASDYGNGYLYLEILNSSMDPLAKVIAYPYNSSSSNQQWWDAQQSDGYYSIQNLHSGLVLDRWDDYSGPGSDGGCSSPMQYWWVDEPQQHWGYRVEYSNYYGAWFTMWVNKAGCSGDLYQDTLGVNNSTAAGYGRWTTQFHTDHCVYGNSYGIYHQCYWRRGTP